jgi:acyl dehydratase
MPIQYPQVLNLSEAGVPLAWSEQEVMLYALAIGLGNTSSGERELPFVYEQGLKVTPTFAAMALYHVRPGDLGIDQAGMLHGAQAMEFFRPLPANAKLVADSRVVSVHDRGRDRGAILLTEITIRDPADGAAIATLTNTIFARRDGGFGGPGVPPPPPHPMPGRAPDLSLDFAMQPNQALLYRLLGDRNPLHADPAVARAAGFEKPILHGLCTYGVTCRAVLQAYADYDPARIRSHAARFAAPVYPGDVLSIDLWADGDVVSFEAHVRARGVTVIKHGRSVVADRAP